MPTKWTKAKDRRCKRRMRKKRFLSGVCITCAQPRKDLGSKYCEDCKKAIKKRDAAVINECIRENYCVRCKTAECEDPAKLCCEKCRKLNAEYARAYRLAKKERLNDSRSREDSWTDL